MGGKQEKAAKSSKPWKGEKRSGPTPARHIPWPEIFKHHISVVEGHTRMLEMIQKHTAKGTGNWDTITAMVNRSHEMLRQSKDSSRSFIPPPNQRDQVPLGSSSASMYPGYSPADIEYGKAAEEFGQAVGEMRLKDAEWQPPTNGAEYQIGQAHGAKRKLFFQKNKEDSEAGKADAKAEPAEKSEEGEKVTEELTNGNEGNPYFVIDTNPTPVALPSKKRPRKGEEGETKKSKKGKEKEKDVKDKGKEKEKDEKETEKEADGEENEKEEEGMKEVVIETEDISAEVEARLKVKGAKAKSKEKKEEKKRRRESGSEDAEKVAKKSKKDKEKKREAEDGGSGGREKKKKKKDAE